MNRVLHMGLTLGVTVHMLYGCCLHHAHGGPSGTTVFAVEASCPCHQHAQKEKGEPRDHGRRHQPCDGARCVFTRPDSNDAPDLSPGDGCPNPVCVSPGTATPSGIDRVDSSPGKLGEPIPLHLLNQAFLL